MTKQEQLDNATRLFDLAKSKTMPKSFLTLLLNLVLDLGPEVGVYSKDHFREFLDMNDKTASCFINNMFNNNGPPRPTQTVKKNTNWN